MKRRVGKYKDKIIVEGDKNEFKSHEVSIKELAGTDNGGGGDVSNIPCYYYKIIKTPDSEYEFDMFFGSNGYFEYVVNANSNGTFQTNIIGAYGDYTNIIAVKLINIPIVVHVSKGDKIYTITVSGDIVNRTYSVLSKVSEGITKEIVQQQIDVFATQITKEEYESLITIKPE